GDLEALPVGEVLQVYSLYCDVEHGGRTFMCVVRKALVKVHGEVVVGDRVRFRQTRDAPGPGTPNAVVEQILPRKTVLTRAEKQTPGGCDPIVANADQVLIVASLLEPKPKWGLIDRVIVSARAGALQPIVCLNKIDLT